MVSSMQWKLNGCWRCYTPIYRDIIKSQYMYVTLWLQRTYSEVYIVTEHCVTASNLTSMGLCQDVNNTAICQNFRFLELIIVARVMLTSCDYKTLTDWKLSHLCTSFRLSVSNQFATYRTLPIIYLRFVTNHANLLLFWFVVDRSALNASNCWLPWLKQLFWTSYTGVTQLFRLKIM